MIHNPEKRMELLARAVANYRKTVAKYKKQQTERQSQIAE
jgi:hypothetical protein